MSANDTHSQKDPLAGAPTPDRDIPGISDLSKLSKDDRVELDSHQSAFEVVNTASRRRKLKNNRIVDQHAVELESTHHAGGRKELKEAINLAAADREVIEIVDRADDTPVRVFREGDDGDD